MVPGTKTPNGARHLQLVCVAIERGNIQRWHNERQVTSIDANKSSIEPLTQYWIFVCDA